MKRNSRGPTSDAQRLWGKVIGIDNKTDQERTFTVYTQRGSFLIVNDEGHERLAGPDCSLSKYDVFREVMAQFQVHELRVGPTLNAKLHAEH